MLISTGTMAMLISTGTMAMLISTDTMANVINSINRKQEQFAEMQLKLKDYAN